MKTLCSWAGYVCLLAILALSFLITNAYLLFLLIVLLLALPWLSLLIFHLSARRLTVHLTKEKGVPYIEIEGVSALGSPLIRLWFEEENCFTKQRRQQILAVNKRTPYPCEAFAMGGFRICFTQLEMCDALGLFYRRKEMKQTLHYEKLPAPQPLPCLNAQLQGSARHDNGWRDTHEVREYQNGDSLRLLHHKLSYKINKPMVRIFENDVRARFTLFLDLSLSLAQCEETIALFQGAVQMLLSQGYATEVCWQDESGSHTRVLEDVQGVTACLRAILFAPKCKKRSLPAHALALAGGLYQIREEGGDGNVQSHAAAR